MNAIEKELVAKLAQLPAEIQAKFLDQASGAVTALDVLKPETAKRDHDE